MFPLVYSKISKKLFFLKTSNSLYNAIKCFTVLYLLHIQANILPLLNLLWLTMSLASQILLFFQHKVRITFSHATTYKRGWKIMQISKISEKIFLHFFLDYCFPRSLSVKYLLQSCSLCISLKFNFSINFHFLT